MSNNMVKNWFDEEYGKLAKVLQHFHLNGGKLKGDVDVVYGRGLSGFVGKRIANKLNIPLAGKHSLIVDVSHHENGLHWDRIFNSSNQMKSIFEPVGTKLNGYWREKTGPLEMKLTVDIIDGGWHWRCLSFSFAGIPLPVWIFPNSKAYKTIENGRYKFYVGFDAPILGHLLSYSGMLDLE